MLKGIPFNPLLRHGIEGNHVLKPLATIVLCLTAIAGVAVFFDVPIRLKNRLTPAIPLPASASVDDELVGTYYFGDGLGVNQELVLRPDGTFSCQWTGCLGDYGSTTGTWDRDGDRFLLSVKTATGMFLRSPLENMTIVMHNERPHFIEKNWISFVEEFGEDSITMATFSPTD